MAEFGARFRTSSMQTQIDENYVNHMLRSKGVFSTGIDGYGYIDVFCESPMLAFRSPAMCAIIKMQDISPGVKRYTFVTMQQTNTTAARISAQVEWWLFDRARYGQLFNLPYSLRIRHKTTGETVFDARGKYLRVVNSLIGRTQVLPGDGGDRLLIDGVTFSGSGTSCAVIQAAPVNEFEAVVIGVGPTAQYMLFWGTSSVRMINSNTFYGHIQGWQQAGPYDPGGSVDYGPTYRRAHYGYLVVDVTDF